LKESKVLIEANNSEMYFVYFPSPIRYQKTLIKKAIMKFLMPTVYYHSLEQKEDVLKIVRSLNIPIIDLDEGLFKLLENPLSYVPFGITGHSTEKGYKLVAETISNRINEIEKNQ